MPKSLLENQWQLYMGILVESTTYKNQRWFHVFVPEFLPTKMGDVSAEHYPEKISLPNKKTQKQEETEIKITETIYADYFGITSGMDVPDMYRGMQVLVLNRIGADKWYWIPLERDDSYKTFEHFRVSCADECLTNKTPEANKDEVEERDKGLTDDNTYFLEIDTKDHKHVLLSTSSSDGEEWRYFFKIDAEEHTVELWDNCVDGSQPNNTIKLESRPFPDMLGRITIQNAAGNSIIMKGEDTEINVPRNLAINVGGDTIIKYDGNVSTVIKKDEAKIVEGNYFETINKSKSSVVLDNKIYLVKNNQFEVIGSLSADVQKNQVSLSVDSKTEATSTYALGAGTSHFQFGQWTALCQIISINASNAWSLICKKWQETAEKVSGSVVALIRGGHH